MARSIFIFFIFLGLSLPDSYCQKDTDRLYMGMAQFEYGNYENALSSFNQAILLSPGKGYELYRGKVYLELKNYKLAKNDFLKAAITHPSQSYIQLARLYALEGDNNNAVNYIKKHLGLPDRMDRVELLNLPDIEILKGSTEWNKLWETNWYSDKDLNLEEANQLISKNDPNHALDILDKLLLLHPDNHRAVFLRGRAYELMDDYKFAFKDYKSALELSPGNGNYLIHAAQVSAKLTRKKEAISYGRQAIASKQDPLYFKEMGIICYDFFDNANAITYLEKYLQWFNKDEEAQLILARNYYELNEFEKALTITDQLLLNDQSNLQAFITRGNIHLQKNEASKALFDYSMALDLNPNDYRIYMNRASLFIEEGNTDKACRDLHKAYRLGYKKAVKLIQEHCRD